MRVSRWAWWLVAILLCVPATRADDPIGRISFGVSGGYSTYGLSAVNDRIENEGNQWLDEKAWNQLDAMKNGWTFWGDFKVPVPLDMVGVKELYGIPLKLFLSAGYGYSSGKTGGDDYNELIEVKAEQTAMHFRLLYVVPWRFHSDVRIFAGGGPLFISEQKLTASHTSRRSAGVGQTTQETRRLEEVTYKGDGTGFQFGTTLEYLMTEHLTLAFDLGYRWAGMDYKTWTVQNGVKIEDTNEVAFDDGTTSLERLHRDASYVLYGFLDSENSDTEPQTSEGPQYGPHVSQLKPLSTRDLDIDLSGFQIQVGFRLYLF